MYFLGLHDIFNQCAMCLLTEIFNAEEKKNTIPALQSNLFWQGSLLESYST